MRLRCFEAGSMAEALARMRRELGEEAVLIASQPNGSGGVRVTAAVELAGDDLASLLGSAAKPLRDALAACLDQHGVPAALRDALLTDLNQVQAAADPANALAELLARRFRFAHAEAAPPRPLALVGPPGAGKTASLVRLAVQAAVGGKRVRVLSADAGRAGAKAQLEELLRPLELAPAFAQGPEQLARLIGDTASGTAILLDTSGVNPFHGGEMAALAELLRATRAEPVLVLPAGLDPLDGVEAAGNFAAMGARRIVVGKLDAARRLGGLLAAADIGLVFAGAGIAPAIGRGLAALTAQGLARVLLHRAGPRGSGGAG
jgi:flagellar biosynthesis protein FlhF